MSLLILLGCQKAKEATRSTSPTKKQVSVVSGLETTTPKTDSRQPVTNQKRIVRTYTQYLDALESCSLVKRGIDPKCPAWTAFSKWRKKNQKQLAQRGLELAHLAESRLKHRADAIRLHAASVMGRVKAAHDVRLRVLLRAAKVEKTPQVLIEMLRSAGRFIGQSEDVRTFILKASNHASASVRIQAASWMTSSYATDDASLSRVIEMVRTDPSVLVQKSVCRRLGARPNSAALSLLAKETTEPDSPLYGACLKGLIGAWSNPRTDSTPNRAAYTLSIARLKNQSRTATNPPWQVVSALVWAGHPSMAKRAPWLRKGDVVNLLLEIIADRRVSWVTRNTAIDIAERLGCVARRFKELAREYEGSRGRDLGVLRKLIAASQTALKLAESAEKQPGLNRNKSRIK